MACHVTIDRKQAVVDRVPKEVVQASPLRSNRSASLVLVVGLPLQAIAATSYCGHDLGVSRPNYTTPALERMQTTYTCM